MDERKAEGRLAQWVTQQQRAQASLTAELKQLLESLPRWSWENAQLPKKRLRYKSKRTKGTIIVDRPFTDESESTTIVEEWQVPYDALKAWLSANDNFYPRHDAKRRGSSVMVQSAARKEEVKLAKWVHDQQINETILLQVLKDLLNELPKWSWEIGQLPICGEHGLQGWYTKYDALRKWLWDHDDEYPKKFISLSKWKDDESALEVSLGQWVHAQRQLKAKNSKLMQGKWQGINRCDLFQQLPGWSWELGKVKVGTPSSLPQEHAVSLTQTMQQVVDAPPLLEFAVDERLGEEMASRPATTWKDMFDLVVDFYQFYHRLPIPFHHSDNERMLAEWYYGDECNSDPHKMEGRKTRAQWLADFRELQEWAAPAPSEQAFRMLTI